MTKTLISYRQSHLRGILRAHTDIPGDKSISHRALLLASLATGNSLVDGLNNGEDVEHTQLALEALGVRIENKGPGRRLIYGIGDAPIKQPVNPLFLGNSGTTARMIAGLIAPFPITVPLYGDPSLSQRPMRRMSSPLTAFGAKFDLSPNDTLPMTIRGAENSIPIEHKMTIPSAQIKSAIIIAGMRTEGITTVIEPTCTRDHTERMLQYLGAPIVVTKSEQRGGQKIQIIGKSRFTAKNIQVPADPSAAAFFAVAAIITPHSQISIEGINWNPYRRRVFEILQLMGANIVVTNLRESCGEPIADIQVSSADLTAISLDAKESPSLIDEYPILAVAAGVARGTSILKGLRELRYKESDRLDAILRNLNLCGIDTRVDDDTLTISGIAGSPIFGGVTVNTNRDHRIAMAFYVLGMISRNPIIIQGSDCVASSFPNFINVLDGLSYTRAA